MIGRSGKTEAVNQKAGVKRRAAQFPTTMAPIGIIQRHRSEFYTCFGCADQMFFRGPSVLPEPTPLPELSKRTEATPMPTPGAEKPSIEISAGAPSEKPAPIVKQTPHPKTLTTPIATVEKNTGKADHYATGGARTQSARTYPGDPDNIVGSKSCGD
jgi:hypothetical protein